MGKIYKMYTAGRYHTQEISVTETIEIEADFKVSLLSSASGNKYQFNLSGLSSETLGLCKGKDYVFSSDSFSVHPFFFSTTFDGVHNGGISYSTGITNFTDLNGSVSFKFTPQDSAPDNLYYYCTQHSGMGGRIRILDFDNTVENESFIQAGNDLVFDVFGNFADYQINNSTQFLQLNSSATCFKLVLIPVYLSIRGGPI